MKKILDIDSLSEIEKKWFLNETWCSNCGKADLGIIEPKLYIENDTMYISGKYIDCGTVCVAKITEKHVNQ